MTPTHAIAAALTAQGITTSKGQAIICGELPTAWSKYLRGHNSPRAVKVEAWLDAAEVSGFPMVLVLDGGQWMATLVPPS